MDCLIAKLFANREQVGLKIDANRPRPEESNQAQA